MATLISASCNDWCFGPDSAENCLEVVDFLVIMQRQFDGCFSAVMAVGEVAFRLL